MAARPQVSVVSISKEASKDQVAMPSVFLAPIRTDIVHFVHTNMAKNRRQPYAVSENAGHQHSAESWGTGRAVARIPRVSGGGTSRAGQGAFGNMCRKGRMFAPTKIWRKWHRKINQNQKRYAVVSALAASAVPALVMARGHRVDQVPEIPLVLANAAEAVQKTKAAVAVLETVGATSDVEHARDSKKLRAGAGKARNRRYVARRGPLVIYNEDKGITQAFRNIPGVELCQVDSLNLLQLAPGGHLGRFVIWTKDAFQRLDSIWGSVRRLSTTKKDYHLPRNIMSNSDLTRLINSDEVQSKVRPPKTRVVRARQKKNPLTNLGALVKLNPYALTVRRAELRRQAAVKAKRTAVKEAKLKGQPLKRSPKELAQRKLKKAHRAVQRATFKRINREEYVPPQQPGAALLTQ